MLALLLTFSVFSRRGFEARVASAVVFGFLLILGMGIAAPDFMVDVQLEYAINRSVEARENLEKTVSSLLGVSVDEHAYELPQRPGGAPFPFTNISGRQRMNELARKCSQLGIFSLPRLQLESLSDRFFDSPFADDARLVSELLLGHKPRDEALAGLEPLLLSHRLEFELESWTALRLGAWAHLFGSQAVSHEMLLGVADRRMLAGQLADAEAALNAVIASRDEPNTEKAIMMLFGIYDYWLGDVEGGLNRLDGLLNVAPECVFAPEVRATFAEIDESTHRQLEAIASSQENNRMRALAHLRLFFTAERCSDDATASHHLDELTSLSDNGLSRLELGLRLYRRASREQGAAGLRLIQAGMELCEGLEAPFLLLASRLPMPDGLSDVHEIALRRLVAHHERSMFFRDGLSQLVTLLEKQGRSHEANELLIMHAERLDLLSDDDLARRARDLLRQY